MGAVQSGDALPEPDDGAADSGDVQRTPDGFVPQSAILTSSHHHQRHGNSNTTGAVKQRKDTQNTHCFFVSRSFQIIPPEISMRRCLLLAYQCEFLPVELLQAKTGELWCNLCCLHTGMVK